MTAEFVALANKAECRMPAYWIGQHEITDGDKFAAYLREVIPMIERAGGRYLTRPGAHEVLEGHWRPDRVVIVEFPSMAALKGWYTSPEYQPLIALRQSAAKDVLTEVARSRRDASVAKALRGDR